MTKVTKDSLQIITFKTIKVTPRSKDYNHLINYKKLNYFYINLKFINIYIFQCNNYEINCLKNEIFKFIFHKTKI